VVGVVDNSEMNTDLMVDRARRDLRTWGDVAGCERGIGVVGVRVGAE
jgi:hypothetical protein